MTANMKNSELAGLLFPHVTHTISDMETIYPERHLPPEAMVTRIGPSPTGFIHLGNLYNAVIAERLAHQSGGVFFLRIEDTDSKREVKDAVHIIISSMRYYDIRFDEGATETGDSGDYGPYRQSLRKDIYHVFAKHLVEQGMAYPCFCSEDSISGLREKQAAEKADIGYYGKWAVCRALSLAEIKERTDRGEPFVLRYKCPDDSGGYVQTDDAIRGAVRLPSNRMDFVLLKSNGIPTYHFAHAVDDHLMRTTHVIRGEEWLPSLPMHLQLFDSFGWKRPVYCHTATLMKTDGASKRKLSKRKDPELALEYYRREGYIPEAMWNYFLTILNSNFEEWRLENPSSPYTDFLFSIDKMSSSGALFDLIKLNDISKNVLSGKTAEELYDMWISWTKEFDPDYYKTLSGNRKLAIEALDIGRTGEKKRKDLITLKQTCDYMRFYFYEPRDITFPDNMEGSDCKSFLEKYLIMYSPDDDKETWFNKLKETVSSMDGYTAIMKEYKKSPSSYKGSIADLSNALRIALTGRDNSPDIWEISRVIGEDSVKRRIRFATDHIRVK